MGCNMHVNCRNAETNKQFSGKVFLYRRTGSKNAIERIIMKRLLCMSILAASLMVTLMPAKSYAGTYGLGWYFFYAQWEPSFRDLVDDYESDPLPLMGPYISGTMYEKITLSFLMYFSAGTGATYNIEGTESSGPYTIGVSVENVRADVDLSIGYKLTDQLSLLTGLKGFMLLTGGPAELDSGAYYGIITEKGEGEVNSSNVCYGYALGVSYSIPLIENLSLTLGTSFVYINSFMSLANEYYIDPSFPGELTELSVDYEYKGVGNNSSVSLAYYMEYSELLGVSIILGGRFQVITYYDGTVSSDTDTGVSVEAPDLSNEYFYGITLAAVMHASD